MSIINTNLFFNGSTIIEEAISSFLYTAPRRSRSCNYVTFFNTLISRIPKEDEKEFYSTRKRIIEIKTDFILNQFQDNSDKEFFDYNMFFSNEKNTYIKFIFSNLIKKHALFSSSDGNFLFHQIKDFKCLDLLIQSIKENFFDFTCCRHLRNEDFQQLLNDNTIEEQKSFYYDYKQKLLSCNSLEDYLVFKDEHYKVNINYSLSYIEPFILLNHKLFDDFFPYFSKINISAKSFVFFDDQETFDNFIFCLKNYKILFINYDTDFNKIYYKLDNYNNLYSEYFLTEFIQCFNFIQLTNFIEKHHQLMDKLITKSILYNISVSDSIDLKSIPLSTWNFFYIKNKPFTRRVLERVEISEEELLYKNTLLESFTLIDNLSDF